MHIKLRHIIFWISLLFSTDNLFGQTNQFGRLFIPYLDKESQSNVIVTVESAGQSCPSELTNTLSNTNLFTPEEQNQLKDVIIRYKNYTDFTTNSGPPGSILVGLYKTNYVVLNVGYENWVGRFQYTNIAAQEEITFGSHSTISARFLTKTGKGYGVWISPTGYGLTFRFTQSKDGVANGLHATFTDFHLEEYWHYTNGMVFGNFLMWDIRNNNLRLEAEFKAPYDLKSHALQIQRQ